MRDFCHSNLHSRIQTKQEGPQRSPSRIEIIFCKAILPPLRCRPASPGRKRRTRKESESRNWIGGNFSLHLITVPDIPICGARGEKKREDGSQVASGPASFLPPRAALQWQFRCPRDIMPTAGLFSNQWFDYTWHVDYSGRGGTAARAFFCQSRRKSTQSRWVFVLKNWPWLSDAVLAPA